MLALDRRNHSFIQIVQYCVTGGAYFFSGLLAFYLFDHGLHWPLFWANTTANAVGITVNFILQHTWVFKTHRRKRFQHVTLRYAIITAVDVFIDYFILRWLKIWGVSYYISKFLSAGVFMTIWNYFWYKYWVFHTD